METVFVGWMSVHVWMSEHAHDFEFLILTRGIERSKAHTHSPNIHTSLAEVKRLKFIDSGAIHLIGSFPLEAGNRERGENETECEWEESAPKVWDH